MKSSTLSCVKFQTFKVDELITKNAPKSTYHIETTGTDSEQSWYNLLKSQEISYDMHLEIIDYCLQKEIMFCLDKPNLSFDLPSDIGVGNYQGSGGNGLIILDYNYIYIVLSRERLSYA